MERPTCRTCPFWQSLDEETEGWCRLNPRLPVVFPATEGTVAHEKWRLPQMESWEWCSHHPDFPEYLASLKNAEEPKDDGWIPFTAKTLPGDHVEQVLALAGKNIYHVHSSDPEAWAWALRYCDFGYWRPMPADWLPLPEPH